MTSISLLDMHCSNWTDRYVRWEWADGFLHEGLEYPCWFAFLNPIDVADHLWSCEKAEIANGVGNVEHMELEVHLETPRHLSNSACHVITLVLGTGRQAITALLPSCPVVCVDRRDDDHWLFWRMATFFDNVCQSIDHRRRFQFQKDCQTHSKILNKVRFMSSSSRGCNGASYSDEKPVVGSSCDLKSGSIMDGSSDGPATAVSTALFQELLSKLLKYAVCTCQWVCLPSFQLFRRLTMWLPK